MFAAMSLLSSMTKIRMGGKLTRVAAGMLECAAAAKFPQAPHRLHKRKRPKEVSLGEHTSLGPKATAPITVICLSPDLTLGVSSRTYSGVDTRRVSIKFTLNSPSPFVNRRAP